jgi:hypothetical protein
MLTGEPNMNCAKTLDIGDMLTRNATPWRTTSVPLARERKFFQAIQNELSQKYGGMFVLIKDERLIGVYLDARSAYHVGSSKFGWEPFLVQKIS